MAEAGSALRRRDAWRATLLISPAYLWLMVAVFLPLSAMLFFSFQSEGPFGDGERQFVLRNYLAFF